MIRALLVLCAVWARGARAQEAADEAPAPEPIRAPSPGDAAFEAKFSIDRARYNALTQDQRIEVLEIFARDDVRKETEALEQQAQCYVDRYPELHKKFCTSVKGDCNLTAALDHWKTTGQNKEKRRFHCGERRPDQHDAKIREAVSHAIAKQPKIKGMNPKVFAADLAKVLSASADAAGQAPERPSPEGGIAMNYALTCYGPCDTTATASLDIVVAAFDRPATPVVRAVARAAPARLTPVRAFLYCKGLPGCAAEDVEASRALASEVVARSLANVGRCDHAYAFHVIALRGDYADATLFLKASAPWHVQLGAMANVLGAARNLPANLEAFCARAVSVELPSYELPEYVSERCKRSGDCYDDEHYKRADVRPLSAWLAAHGGVDVDMSNVVPACRGGLFGAGARALGWVAPAAYAAVERELAAANSLEAGHYAERSWLALFGVEAVPPPVRNRMAVYANAYDASLDLPDGYFRPPGWDVDFFFFGTKKDKTPPKGARRPGRRRATPAP